MLNSMIVTTGIAWGSMNPQYPVYQNPEREAAKSLAKASYLELKLDKVAKRIEKRYIPKELKEYGAWPILVVKVVSEKRLSYEWTF